MDCALKWVFNESSVHRIPGDNVVTLYWGWMNSMAVLADAWKLDKMVISEMFQGLNALAFWVCVRVCVRRKRASRDHSFSIGCNLQPPYHNCLLGAELMDKLSWECLYSLKSAFKMLFQAVFSEISTAAATPHHSLCASMNWRTNGVQPLIHSFIRPLLIN